MQDTLTHPMTFKNPSKALRAAALEVLEDRYVVTCHSETCGCMSHDPGFRLFRAVFPDGMAIRGSRGSVHSHSEACLESELKPQYWEENEGEWFVVSPNQTPTL